MNKQWNDIKIGDTFTDGSTVTQIHQKHIDNCLKLTFKKKTDESSIIVSEDHLFLCDLSHIKSRFRKIIFNETNEKIALETEYVIFLNDLILEEDKQEELKQQFIRGEIDFDKYPVQEYIVKDESKIKDVKKNLIWLTALEIHRILNANVGYITSNNWKITDCLFVGEKECFCVSTDTTKYTTLPDGPIHHNSVTIRNIIFHCLTHGVKIGLVDLKITEFESYKGCRDVIGVANTVEEAAELLRLGRQLMYKRNKELAQAGVVDLLQFKPKQPTDEIEVFGRPYNENDKLIIKTENNEEKEITFKELETMLYS